MNRTRYAIALAMAFGSVALVAAGLDGVVVAGGHVPVCGPAAANPPPPVCQPAQPTPPPPVCAPAAPVVAVHCVKHHALHDHLTSAAVHVHEALHHVVHHEKVYYTISESVPQPCTPAAASAHAPVPALLPEPPAK
jgi:hypothetical protein